MTQNWREVVAAFAIVLTLWLCGWMMSGAIQQLP